MPAWPIAVQGAEPAEPAESAEQERRDLAGRAGLEGCRGLVVEWATAARLVLVDLRLLAVPQG